MAAWCLPKNLVNEFLAKILDGTFAPSTLRAMSSAERRAAFAEVLGPENAKEVNAQFESKLLLKDQQRGMVSWAKKVVGINEPTRNDLISTIQKLDKVLNPEDERAFLGDLAEKKLGVAVTADEARELMQLAQKAEDIKASILGAGTGDYRSGWTPESGTAYGMAKQALLDKVNSLKPHGMTLRDALYQLPAITREAETSILHWSAPFVQLVGMISTKEWWAGLGKQFQYFASEANYQQLVGYITGHPDYELAVDGKLGLTQLTDKLTSREEQLQSHLLVDANQWLSDRTGVPNLIRGWQRSFVGVCNYVRFERFVNLLDAARMHGEDVSAGSKVVSDMAKVVNNFTGRGNLGEADSAAAVGPILNTVFYSPRKMVATMEMFNPYFYATLSPTARGAAIRQISGLIAATGATMMLARFMGAKVSFDPRDVNFAKIDIGGEKLDMTGGNSSYLRLLANVATGQRIGQNGKMIDLDGSTPHGATRADMAINFLRGRLAPNAAMLADALYGHNQVGQPFNIGQEAQDRLTPIVIDDFIKYYQNNPEDTAALIPSLTAFLGVSLQSPEPPMSESGRDVWGKPLSATTDFNHDPVNQALQQSGYVMHFPSQKIKGVPLTADQFDDYSRLSGAMAHARLEQVTQQPWFETLPPARRASIIHSIVMKTREAASTAVEAQSQGSANDIIRLSREAKQAAMAAPAP